MLMSSPSHHARIVMTNIVDADRFRARLLARGAGGGNGGSMDDVLRRLGVLESLVAKTREEVSAMNATLPHLATKADISSLETRIIRWIVATTITVASAAFTIAKFVK
jgi:hypothetical protein